MGINLWYPPFSLPAQHHQHPDRCEQRSRDRRDCQRCDLSRCEKRMCGGLERSGRQIRLFPFTETLLIRALISGICAQDINRGKIHARNSFAVSAADIPMITAATTRKRERNCLMVLFLLVWYCSSFWREVRRRGIAIDDTFFEPPPLTIRTKDHTLERQVPCDNPSRIPLNCQGKEQGVQHGCRSYCRKGPYGARKEDRRRPGKKGDIPDEDDRTFPIVEEGIYPLQIHLSLGSGCIVSSIAVFLRLLQSTGRIDRIFFDLVERLGRSRWTSFFPFRVSILRSNDIP